jgi:hypothetical protein
LCFWFSNGYVSFWLVVLVLGWTRISRCLLFDFIYTSWIGLDWWRITRYWVACPGLAALSLRFLCCRYFGLCRSCTCFGFGGFSLWRGIQGFWWWSGTFVGWAVTGGLWVVAIICLLFFLNLYIPTVLCVFFLITGIGITIRQWYRDFVDGGSVSSFWRIILYVPFTTTLSFIVILLFIKVILDIMLALPLANWVRYTYQKLDAVVEGPAQHRDLCMLQGEPSLMHRL